MSTRKQIKPDLSNIDTQCYYIGNFNDHTYILKFKEVTKDKITGLCYKVENSPAAQEMSLSIIVSKKTYKISINGRDIPLKINPATITADIITGEYTTERKKHEFCFSKYKRPEYKEFDTRLEKGKYNVIVEKDIIYGNAKGFWSHIPENISEINLSPRDLDLKMDIYMPQDDTKRLHPFIMLIHGGVFLFGDKADEDCRKWSQHFASIGFVVASINYRMGFRPSADQIDCAGYRATQDANAAMRYMVHNAAKYRINTNWIFASGTSAGAITALNLAFMRDENRPKSTYGLGDIESISPQYTEKFSIKAVANMWGAVHDIDMISNAKTSIISFHGDADKIVPYGYDYPLNVKTKDLKELIKIIFKKHKQNPIDIINRNIPSTISDNNNIFKYYHKYSDDVLMILRQVLLNKMYGSSCIDEKAKENGNRSELFTKCGGGHKLHKEDNNIVPYFYFIQEKVTDFFIEELIPRPISIEQDKSEQQCYRIKGGNIAQIYWKVENGIILESQGRKAKIIFVGDGKKQITVSGKYKNGIGFKKEMKITK